MLAGKYGNFVDAERPRIKNNQTTVSQVIVEIASASFNANILVMKGQGGAIDNFDTMFQGNCGEICRNTCLTLVSNNVVL
jgi:hypothetical protein